MNSETYLDFCFIKEASGNFAVEIDMLLSDLFKDVRLNWYLDEKSIDGVDIVVAEVKGMSRWESEEEAIEFIEIHAGDLFWKHLHGYQLNVYMTKRGCNTCGAH
ncbi:MULTISPECIES: hypothetical protein [Peribacillus]|uniref:hypothetical protein n=1 Tax=Peribacillus TaxID=2675229 RepID=UPI000B6AF134|nr:MULTISPECIES: hypothetical protein [Peribacillus]MDF9761931.1 hypothetical protein [Peribacillus simplex]MDV7766651.1 hypothetical protein [Peribacillus sp. CSMR9]MDW7615355.1 hypothetical protein [Peribacillus simplex]SNT21585.1 hypothetical protein SAMN05444672_109108 [Bacillus sp. OK838]